MNKLKYNEKIIFEKNFNTFNAINNFYKNLLNNNFEVKFQAATPDKNYYHFYLDNFQISKKYNFYNQQNKNPIENQILTGMIKAIDLKTRKFKFKNSTNNRIIQGDLDEDFTETLFDFDRIILANIIKQTMENNLGKPKIKYSLLSIKDK